ncbi:hypothetical protein [Pseudomonas avellanae]|uniref:hypothetical protein n=1 Tax=Pseudomonas avellanae TaxID=46257 RepID=UPI000ACE139B
MDSLNIRAECRLNKISAVTSNKGLPYQTKTEIVGKAESPKAQRINANSLELFFVTPNQHITHSLKWAVRAQFILTRNGKEHYFPAPTVKDDTKYSHNFSKPEFFKINQPFWADEITHEAKTND